MGEVVAITGHFLKITCNHSDPRLLTGPSSSEFRMIGEETASPHFPFTGISSMVTELQPRTYAECGYRATVAAKDLLSEPDLAHLIHEPAASCWIIPGRYLTSYPIEQATKYNLVMVHPGVAVQDQ